MKITETDIAGVLVIEPRVWEDERGFFFESFNVRQFTQLTGLAPVFVQDNHSRSQQHVLRGLHYQIAPMAQEKLVRVIQGEVFDVVVDIRKNSPTFGRWIGEVLSAENKRQLWIPEGMAHGFMTLSAQSEILYKTTQYYCQTHERALRWDDPQLAIAWPLTAPPVLSAKDQAAAAFKDC